MSRQYVPDLPGILALYGRNYHRLLYLLTQSRRRQAGPDYYWGLGERRLLLRCLEQTQYTEKVLVTLEAPLPERWQSPSLEVRLYHDAAVAEVLSGQQFSPFLAKYPYPNGRMVQRDEKFQVNLFLAELLSPNLRQEWRLESEEIPKT